VADRLGNEVPLRIRFVKGHPVPEFPDECEPHTDSPRSYLQWGEWAKEMERTHVQRQCKGCGLWSVWEPRDSGSAS
jgi:hypothetical protein